MVLHTFNKVSAWNSFSKFVQAEDKVLFIEDGVYCLIDPALDVTGVTKSPPFAITDDICARGLSSRVNASVKQMDYRNFVQLCCETDQVISWA